MTPTTQLLITDQALRAINSKRRRAVLQHLRPTDESAVKLDELAEAVVERTDDTREDFETVEMELHHRDLPQLDATGILKYDGRTQTTRYHGDRGVELLLYVVDEHFE